MAAGNRVQDCLLKRRRLVQITVILLVSGPRRLAIGLSTGGSRLRLPGRQGGKPRWPGGGRVVADAVGVPSNAGMPLHH